MILLHYIFTIKFRKRFLDARTTPLIERHIRCTCERWGITIRAIAVNGDHVHLLIEQPRKRSAAAVAQEVKRYSSIMIRKQVAQVKSASPRAFWGRRYFVKSIGGSRRFVQAYIDNQNFGGLSSE
jgi:REP element-mobilizing transposase RayT